MRYLKALVTLLAVAASVGLAACGDDDGSILLGNDRAELDSVAFVMLGPGEPMSELDGPFWVGTPEADTMRRQLDQHANDDGFGDRTAAVQAALDRVPPEGSSAVMFVLAGCQDTGAELTISDGAMEPDLTGGENVDCEQANYFLAVFEMPDELAETVRSQPGGPSSNGDEPQLVSFVPLGTGGIVSQTEGPAWLGTAEAEAMATELERAATEGELDADEEAEVQAALGYQPPEGMSAVAFVLAGCQDTGAQLTVVGGTMEPELTNDEMIACSVAEYFLTVFEMPDDLADTVR